MNARSTSSDLELVSSGRTTRRREFPERLDTAIPWGRRGRPPVPTSVLLRTCVPRGKSRKACPPEFKSRCARGLLEGGNTLS